MNSNAHERIRKEYVELSRLKRSLNKMCNSINKEIMQTDVEWMNLTALVQDLKKNEQQSTSKPLGTQLGSKDKKEILVSTQKGQFERGDSIGSNLPNLNLNPNVKSSHKHYAHSDEEFDSD